MGATVEIATEHRLPWRWTTSWVIGTLGTGMFGLNKTRDVKVCCRMVRVRGNWVVDKVRRCFQITWGRQGSTGWALEGWHKLSSCNDPIVVGVVERNNKRDWKQLKKCPEGKQNVSMTSKIYPGHTGNQLVIRRICIKTWNRSLGFLTYLLHFVCENIRIKV